MGKNIEKYKEPLMSGETDFDIIAELVMQGYHEIQEGKGIDGEEFLKEFEKRYLEKENKNSQLFSPAQCQDINETGIFCNHIIAQKMKMQALIWYLLRMRRMK